MNVTLDIRANSEKILSYMRLARSNRIDLVCFPECALTGYIRDHKQIRTSDVYCEISKLQNASNTTGVAIVVGSTLPWKGRVYDAALIIRPHCRMRKYFKRTLTSFDKKYFSKGMTIAGFTVRGIKCGALICRDQNDPLLPQRFKHAKVLFYLSSHHYRKATKLKDKERKNRAFPLVRAIENRTYVAKADAVGSQGDTISLGTSMIVDPEGIVVAEAQRKKEALLELYL